MPRLTFRKRYAWWPVQLWDTNTKDHFVYFTGKYLWRVEVIEMNTLRYDKPWVAYTRYQGREIDEILGSMM